MTDCGVLIGCADGYVRKFQLQAMNDDGTNFDSYVWFGPIDMGGPRLHGTLHELLFTAAQKSGYVDWSVYANHSAEWALSDVAARTGTCMIDGRNMTFRPRCKQNQAWIVLSNGEDGIAWAMERLAIIHDRGGMERL